MFGHFHSYWLLGFLLFSDINECAEGTHHCNIFTEKCVNMPGAYRCDCGDGFSLQEGQCRRKTQ